MPVSDTEPDEGTTEEPTTVECDDNCGALDEPETLEELRAAYEHWRVHGHWAGCAHGC